MSQADSQPAVESRQRRRGHEPQSAHQTKSPRRNVQTANSVVVTADAPATANDPKPPSLQSLDAQQNSAPSSESEAQTNLNQQQSADIGSRLLSMVSRAQAQPIVRYSTEQLLALRDSSLVCMPDNFLPYTPLRPGSQVKLPEMTHLVPEAKMSQMGQYIGLEHIVRNNKDIVMNQQRLPNQGHRGHNASQRNHGAPRASGAATGANAAGGYLIDGGVGYGHKHAVPPAVGVQGSRAHQGRSGSITGNHLASRNYNNSNTNASGSAGSGGSWRSSGVPKVASNASLAGGMIGSNGQSNNLADVGDSIQPEWMNDDLVYDENQSAKRMHDMEEWKRRMKESGGGGPVGNADMNHHHHNQYYQQQQHGAGNDLSEGINNGLSVGQSGDKSGASRGSRFLRMFSANDVPPGPGAVVGMAGSTLPVPGGLVYDANAAAGYVGGPDSQKQGGDQLSKLYKVFGDKLSIGSNANIAAAALPQQELLTSGWAPQDNSAALAMQNAQALSNMHAAESMRVAMMMQAAGANGNAPSVGPVADPGMQQSVAAPLPAAMVPSAVSSAQSQPPLSASTVAGTAVSAQRIKSASPAPINEALRGIVPTSVFRKSARSGSVHSSNAPKRAESTASSSRSGTPARNLPSWLVELSGGSPSSANESAGANVITNESLGSQDLVDTLERGFPALGFKAQHLDNQSVSSLSVQASAGVPSETNGGSIRRESIDTTQSNERLSDEIGSAGRNSNAGNSTVLPPGLNGSSSTTMAAMPSTAAAVSSPLAMHQHQHHIQQHQPIAQLPVGTMAMATPDVLQQMQHQQQQQTIPPPGMLGMLPPHMMMPDGQMIPGLVPPPMGMIPPQHPMGFHPNMMFGMMPPHGMFGGLPPVSMPMGQLGPMQNSMAAGPGPGTGPTSEQHQQMMMLMKMMPSEMPPGMMYNQMPGGPPPPPPHMFAAGMPYQGPPMQIPGSSEQNISIGAPQSPSQAFPQQGQQ